MKKLFKDILVGASERLYGTDAAWELGVKARN